MPKVSSETIRDYINTVHLPNRHQRGCPKNYARTVPLQCLARGMTFEETKAKVKEVSDSLPCECE